VRCSDLEFVQFHPTALAAPGIDPMPLITEALRGEGAVLLDETGNRFVDELAPRDVVARATFARIVSGSKVFLDTREAVSADEFPVHFPTVFAACRAAGIDPRIEPIPVAPAAHYHMGGVEVDAFGRSSREGLWACGEAASTGVHGANRLASNSLLEGVVFARRVAHDIANRSERSSVTPPLAESRMPLPRTGTASAELRRLAYERAGVERNAAGLCEGLERLDRLAGSEDAGRLSVVRAILTAALDRRESRGSHFRTDFPASSTAYAHRSRLDPVA
jgi:L-aspartate oxidase